VSAGLLSWSGSPIVERVSWPAVRASRGAVLPGRSPRNRPRIPRALDASLRSSLRPYRGAVLLSRSPRNGVAVLLSRSPRNGVAVLLGRSPRNGVAVLLGRSPRKFPCALQMQQDASLRS
jgi:hypothetical protein